MKVCTSCGEEFSGEHWVCPACDFQPRLLEGFPAFAPELASGNGGFDDDYFEQLEQIEANHFWFRSRNRLLLAAIGKYFSGAGNFLEIGCGTGFVLSGVERSHSRFSLSGSEISCSGLRIASGRLRQAALFQMDARRIPFKEEFDVIGAFDVLEHIAEDEEVLIQIYRALKTGGGLIATVPQHPSLWSSWDEISRHERRYRRGELARKMRQSGFRVIRDSSFFALLLPVMALSRLGSGKSSAKRDESDLATALAMPALAGKICERICDLERALLLAGLPFPAGGSQLCIGIKDRT